jgi:hypothetical protein
MRDRTVKPAANVIVRAVGEEMVLLDMTRGTYYGLDPIGARIWEMIANGSSLALVVERLLDEYEVTRDELEGDVEKLVAEMEGRGLVTEP